MPYLVTETETDEYGVKHPVGVRERVELITNSLATINRTIPMAVIEGSVTFILDRTRKHAATLPPDEAIEFIFDVITILNEKEGKELRKVYDGLDKYEKKKFLEDCIALNPDGTINTHKGIYIRWEAFTKGSAMRDAIVKIYEKYGDVIKPYDVFVPKPKWGRDIYLGKEPIGYQYILMLKQSGAKNFSVRSTGSISEEGLPEKTRLSKSSKALFSTKPIRFGEYETPNFLIVTDPDDFALVTALYRSSIDGRRWMAEAILDDDTKYNLPDNFTSRTAEILQVYLKSLGVSINTFYDEDEFIGEKEDKDTVIEMNVGHAVIHCTIEESYYLRKLIKIYRKYMKENPDTIYEGSEIWDFIYKNLPFKKKHLTDKIIEIFNKNIFDFTIEARKK